MTQADMLMFIATLGRGLYRRRLLRRIIPGTVMVAVLAFLTALMAGTLLIGGLYAADVAAVHYDISPTIAHTAIGFLTMLATFAFATATWVASRRLMRREPPLAAQANDIAEAFLNGLLEP